MERQIKGKKVSPSSPYRVATRRWHFIQEGLISWSTCLRARIWPLSPRGRSPKKKAGSNIHLYSLLRIFDPFKLTPTWLR
jgi:hypothetical protein